MSAIHLLLLQAALAEPAVSLPGRSLTLLPCSTDATAECWEEAETLRRFAAPPGTEHAPVEVDLRMAWSAQGLLVKATGLPDHAQVELYLGHPRSDVRSRGSSRMVGEGLHTVDLPVKAGQLREARVQLVLREGPESPASVTLPWAPRGAGQLHRTLPLLVVDERSPPPLVELERSSSGLAVVGLGASLHALEAGPESGKHYRGSPVPVDLSGEDMLVLPLPTEPTWLTVRSVSTDADGSPVAQSVQRVHLSPEPARDLVNHGMHPPPRELEVVSNKAFRLTEDLRIVVQDEAARAGAEWLEAELEQRLGIEASVQEGPVQAGDIVFTDLAGVEPPEGGPEAFTLSMNRQQATLRAGSRGGFTWAAVALAQALEHQTKNPRKAVAIEVVDAPDLARRTVYQSANISGRMDLELEQLLAFVDQVLVPARINTLIVPLNDLLQWRSHPELSSRQALSREHWLALRDHVEALGIEFVPGLNLPSHAGWLLDPHPELREGNNTQLMCTRHPETWPLVAELEAELLELFEPRHLHLGHDEIAWKHERAPADERCPRCSGSTASMLLAEDLRWHLAFLEESGVRPMIWADQLVAGHNGAKEGSHRVLELLDESERSQLVVMGWARLGDPVERLAQDREMDLLRVHTAYLDHKRANLAAEAPHLEGEGIGLFVPAPWSTLGFAPGTRPLGYHFTSIVLAGATAWRTDLVERGAIVPSLQALSEHPAYTPGADLLDGRRVALTPQGGADGVGLPSTTWPGGDEPRVARAGAPVLVPVDRAIGGMEFLQAAVLNWDAERALRRSLKQTRSDAGDPLATVSITYADGSMETLPLHLGLDVERLAWDPRAVSLWRTSGSVVLASDELAEVDPGASDLRLYRWRWVNPRPDLEVDRVRVEVTSPGVQLVIAESSAIRP